MARQSFYADAELYDILHEEGTRGDARAMVRIARAFGPPALRRRGAKVTLLEPACGSGRYLVEIAKAGHRGVGFDTSAGMVRYAQLAARRAGQGRAVRAFRAKMESFTLPAAWRADGAFNLINTIRHLWTDAAVIAHLRCMERALKPGGVYIVGVGVCAYGMESEVEDVWKGARTIGGRRVSVTQIAQYLPAPAAGADSKRAALRAEHAISHMTVTTRAKGREPTERHIDSAYTLRSYSIAQWRSLIARAGWDLVAITDHDGVAATPTEPGYYLWILRPPGA